MKYAIAILSVMICIYGCQKITTNNIVNNPTHTAITFHGDSSTTSSSYLHPHPPTTDTSVLHLYTGTSIFHSYNEEDGSPIFERYDTLYNYTIRVQFITSDSIILYSPGFLPDDFGTTNYYFSLRNDSCTQSHRHYSILFAFPHNKDSLTIHEEDGALYGHSWVFIGAQ
ncbi:MAG: hypothetical protein WCG87_07335 [Bacteroidota bacterium]